ncbi:MAG TPA: hypothetical protein VGP73_07205 [Thermoanaerobaculia bacterium]
MSRARQAFDALEKGLAGLAERRPRLALASAAAAGHLRNRLSRRWPSPQQVRTLFPGLDERAAERVAWSIGGIEARNRILIDRIRMAGNGPVAPLIRTRESFSALRPPLILGFFHTGAMQALSAAIERLPGPVLALRQGLLHPPRPPVRIESTEGDGQRRAAAFQSALDHLGAGGFVVVALDVVPGPGLRVPCLGRTIELARGPFAMARLTGTPLLPLAARWRGGEVEIETGDPLAAPPAAAPEAWESALAAAAAHWLERYLLGSPAEVGLSLLRAFLRTGIEG